ncbi:hypothetical protein JZ751_009620 [Albula glossodonta]|uniref:Uncharacterized protein n=1 Tax=Albula glossodonta TaxID=121402 RepID=A0A8T2NY95_9TELE|nr:hypothetical protein JZ751_009620 [Albula glossodonta]
MRGEAGLGVHRSGRPVEGGAACASRQEGFWGRGADAAWEREVRGHAAQLLRQVSSEAENRSIQLGQFWVLHAGEESSCSGLRAEEGTWVCQYLSSSACLSSSRALHTVLALSSSPSPPLDNEPRPPPSPSLRSGRGSASLRASSGPPSSRRLLMCRFMARCSSVLVKLAFSWASRYLSRSRRSSASVGGAGGTACFPTVSSRLRSPASSSSRTSRISFREASTSREEASWAAIGTSLEKMSGPVTLGSVGFTGRAFTRGAPGWVQRRVYQGSRGTGWFTVGESSSRALEVGAGDLHPLQIKREAEYKELNSKNEFRNKVCHCLWTQTPTHLLRHSVVHRSKHGVESSCREETLRLSPGDGHSGLLAGPQGYPALQVVQLTKVLPERAAAFKVPRYVYRALSGTRMRKTLSEDTHADTQPATELPAFFRMNWDRGEKEGEGEVSEPPCCSMFAPLTCLTDGLNWNSPASFRSSHIMGIRGTASIVATYFVVSFEKNIFLFYLE